MSDSTAAPHAADPTDPPRGPLRHLQHRLRHHGRPPGPDGPPRAETPLLGLLHFLVSGPRVSPRVLVSFLSGVILAAAFPSYNHWYLAPLAITGLALATRGQRPRRAALLSMITGLTFFLLHLSWSGVYVGPLPWIALAGFEASYFALMGAFLPRAWRARGGPPAQVLAITGLWVLQEAIRGRLPFGGFPWGRLAFCQTDSPLLGFAALGGAPLVTAAVAAAGALTAVALATVPRPRLPHAVPRPAPGPAPHDPPPPDHPWRTTKIMLALALALPLAGTAVPRPTDGPRTATVAAVQGNVPRPGLDFNAERRAVLNNHARATTDLAQRVDNGTVPRPDLVIWPENASDIDPLANPDAAAVIQKATDAIKTPVLLGTLQDKPDGIRNTSILWGPTGSPTPGPGASYTKRHPAPFGEYIPYRSFFRLFSDKVDLVRKDFVGGPRTGTINTPAARLGPVICFEVAYDSLVRDQVLDGADILTVQTNNATFGRTDESVQQLAMSRLRAVETGRSVIHISTVGISALIAPDGTPLATSE
ncbi:MAG: apolipoprotein N-acyltransferase, partial [Actinomycetota bacterium]|nr:apolipoprotein N-acyltransferase [Actinomycetota bacterium]